jgi:hypothetical protein
MGKGSKSLIGRGYCFDLIIEERKLRGKLDLGDNMKRDPQTFIGEIYLRA